MVTINDFATALTTGLLRFAEQEHNLASTGVPAKNYVLSVLSAAVSTECPPTWTTTLPAAVSSAPTLPHLFIPPPATPACTSLPSPTRSGTIRHGLFNDARALNDRAREAAVRRHRPPGSPHRHAPSPPDHWRAAMRYTPPTAPRAFSQTFRPENRGARPRDVGWAYRQRPGYRGAGYRRNAVARALPRSREDGGETRGRCDVSGCEGRAGPGEGREEEAGKRTREQEMHRGEGGDGAVAGSRVVLAEGGSRISSPRTSERGGMVEKGHRRRASTALLEVAGRWLERFVEDQGGREGRAKGVKKELVAKG